MTIQRNDTPPATEESATGDPHVRPATPIQAALAVVFVGVFMAIMDGFIVMVAAPAKQSDLHATDAGSSSCSPATR
jgi:hypothetical protein